MRITGNKLRTQRQLFSAPEKLLTLLVANQARNGASTAQWGCAKSVHRAANSRARGIDTETSQDGNSEKSHPPFSVLNKVTASTVYYMMQ